MSRHAGAPVEAHIPPRLLARRAAANYLTISPRSLDHLVADGRIKPIRIPGMRRHAFSVAALDALIDSWEAGE
jgi:hypothetical protein